MRIVESPPQTLLDGDVLDESHLHGIIAQFQALGLTVVSVSPSPERDEPGSAISVTLLRLRRQRRPCSVARGWSGTLDLFRNGRIRLSIALQEGRRQPGRPETGVRRWGSTSTRWR